MYFFLVFVPLMSMFTLCTATIDVVDFGIQPPRKDDVGLVLYMTIVNRDQIDYKIYGQMVECCQYITPNDRDCKSMRLVGGRLGFIEAGEGKKVTFVNPNLYLHDRHGHCVVQLLFSHDGVLRATLEHTIPFNTTLGYSSVPPILKHYYSLRRIRRCANVDLDPLDACLPVNCPIKYSGFRSYFNYNEMRCRRVPTCSSPGTYEEMPPLVYIPQSNTCRNLRQVLTSQDIVMMREGLSSVPKTSQPMSHFTTTVSCHHGKLDNSTGICICNRGWTSAPFDHNTYGPGTDIYHMCTVKELSLKEQIVRKHINRTIIYYRLHWVLMLFLVPPALIALGQMFSAAVKSKREDLMV